MNTLKKVNPVIGVVIMGAALMITMSCQKENSMNPGTHDNVVAKNSNSFVFQPGAHMYGASYSVWSARWWKWDLELPLACHPSLDEPCFDVTAGQSGDVWFLGTPITGAPVERTISIPADQALYIGTINVEASDLEAAPFYGATEDERRAIAQSFADL